MASDSKDLVLAILGQLATSLKRLDTDQWAAIERGDFRIAITAAGGDRQPSSAATRPSGDSLVQEIVARLKLAPDRETATTALKSRGVTREVLRGIALASGVHATSRDNKDVLVQRIVESTIGFRLRARAIQGDDSTPLCDPGFLAH